jgi:hypothetical protein
MSEPQARGSYYLTAWRPDGPVDWGRDHMTGKRFLNPFLKVILSLIGMVAIGYQLYAWLMSGDSYDYLTIARALVFAGFTYLLVQSIRQIFHPNE